MNINYSRSKLLSTMFIASFTCTSLMELLSGFRDKINTIDIENVLAFVRYVFLLFGLILSYKKINKVWLLHSAALFTMFIFSYSFFYENNIFLLKTFRSFIPILIMMLMIISIDNYKNFFEQLYKFSIAYCLTIMIFIAYLSSNGLLWIVGGYGSYMSYSYSILPYICSLFYKIFETRFNDYKSLFFAALSFISICIWGGRGAVLSSLCCFFILYIHKCINNNRVHKVLFIFLAIFLLSFIFLTVSFTPILKEMHNIAKSFGIRARFVEKIDINTNNFDNGRSKLYYKALNAIEEQPLKLRGINADYSLVGGYIHNIYLELLYDFGAFLGGIFSIIISLFAFLTVFVFYKNNYIFYAITYFFSISFFRLLVSHSLFINFAFWCWFILVIKQLTKTSYTCINKNNSINSINN